MSATSDSVSVDVPDIGDFEDVPVIEILVSPGDSVAVDDPLMTLESDKATMDVPAPVAGTVRELLVKIGDKVSQGVKLLTLAPSGDGDDGAPTETKAADPVRSAVQAEEQAAPPAPPAAEAPAPAPSSERNGAGPVYASPAVRRVARELGVDLHNVSGSGRKGRITKEDVKAFVDRGPSTPAPSATGARARRAEPAWAWISRRGRRSTSRSSARSSASSGRGSSGSRVRCWPATG